MKFSTIAFAFWALIAATFLFGVLGKEFGEHWSSFRQVGDTSLGRHSVKWMAALALSAAIWICFFLI